MLSAAYGARSVRVAGRSTQLDIALSPPGIPAYTSLLAEGHRRRHKIRTSFAGRVDHLCAEELPLSSAGYLTVGACSQDDRPSSRSCYRRPESRLACRS